MTPAEIQVWIILFMGLGTIITSIGTCVGIIITATRTGVIGSKVDVIHDQTNSRLSRMDADLAAAYKALDTAHKALAQVAPAHCTNFLPALPGTPQDAGG